MIPQVAVTIKFSPFSGYVYKLWYQDRYIVLKCKTFRRSAENINIDINRFFKAYGNPKDRDNDNDKFYQFVFNHCDGSEFTVEPVLISDNPYQLLKCEYQEMLKGKADPKCLNKRFYPYIPAHTQGRPGKSWINRGHYLNFRMWEKRQSTQQKPA